MYVYVYIIYIYIYIAISIKIILMLSYYKINGVIGRNERHTKLSLASAKVNYATL